MVRGNFGMRGSGTGRGRAPFSARSRLLQTSDGRKEPAGNSHRSSGPTEATTSSMTRSERRAGHHEDMK